MNEPERISEESSPLADLLLASARDEAPPHGLLERTLTTVGVAGAAAAAAGTAKAAATGVTGAAGASGATVSAGGGVLGALGLGALAGLFTVGALGLAPDFSAFSGSPKGTPAVVASALPAAAAPAPPPAMIAEDSTRTAALPPAKDEGAPAPAIASSAPRASSSKLAAELALVDEARRALGGDPARTIAILDRYAREFPSGQLAPEAAVLRVEALAKQGDRRGAAAAARRSLEAHPDSPHAERIGAAAKLDAGTTNP